MKCPICQVTVPFSLEMHMIAAHGKRPMKDTVTRFSAKEKRESEQATRRRRPRSKPAGGPKPASGSPEPEM
jgi:hypothetical protein